ncbi:MAG: divalent-cation tolerance protein CutA [Gammaproteobacteria bacterium]|jgi:periplasmic divalent cation tolerance protein|nr:divalent-cation tolerance protein CutA [Gammaproteobacteria bacterium]
MSAEPRIGLCTVPDKGTAMRIAAALVAEQLAACVNIIPAVQSVYRWQGAVEQAEELLLLIKTSDTVWSQLQERILALHPYELPEIISVPIQDGHSNYLNWIINNLKTP